MLNTIGIIQARVSSCRFPGKVLNEFRGKKILDWICESNINVFGRDNVIVATSCHSSDDPVAEFARSRGIKVSRGSLEDVWSRFAEISARTTAEWICRTCADSPLLSSSIIRQVADLPKESHDVACNIHPRSFPRGQSVEILRRRLFQKPEFFPQSAADREHVTPHLYRHPRVRIVNLSNPLGDQSMMAWSVEEPGDIQRLEKAWP